MIAIVLSTESSLLVNQGESPLSVSHSPPFAVAAVPDQATRVRRPGARVLAPVVGAWCEMSESIELIAHALADCTDKDLLQIAHRARHRRVAVLRVLEVLLGHVRAECPSTNQCSPATPNTTCFLARVSGPRGRTR